MKASEAMKAAFEGARRIAKALALSGGPSSAEDRLRASEEDSVFQQGPAKTRAELEVQKALRENAEARRAAIGGRSSGEFRNRFQKSIANGATIAFAPARREPILAEA